ncbi:HNH endonuclease [Beutenbergia cavernae DSM 12333]|uniref:HNH endonuclease n=1 Tax=Beutenbergia cavernae (strain ATCC BAA-8 / DSM 12333 / CCUG 43141 / JCM 11478 / NBRC 16432 / NCIMB 13614 / HKI 0122) TaxID=471853 RepID=C5BVH3_BEUC1|nr:HNH endonuclease signature motif containing protein [Beutenbergia cavernae]ACQ78413.1 HNH endonuclease [Beutenbergia cavernae DSM 12333]
MFDAAEQWIGTPVPGPVSRARGDHCFPGYALVGAAAAGAILEVRAIFGGATHKSRSDAADTAPSPADPASIAEPHAWESLSAEPPTRESLSAEPPTDQSAIAESHAGVPGSLDTSDAAAAPTPRADDVANTATTSTGGTAAAIPEHATDDPELAAMVGSAAAGAAALAAQLAALDATRLSTEELLGVVAAWRRVEAAAAAQVRYAAAALAERTEMNPPALARRSTNGCLAPDELATTLGVSRRAAGTLVHTGQAFTGPLADVGRALAGGLIDAGKAAVYAGVLADLPVAVVLAVVDATLPNAPAWPHHTLKTKLRDAVTTATGADAAQLHAHAAKDRHLRRPEPLPAGMAKLVAVLPAPDAQTIWTACDAAAWSARTTGADPRTLDQLRADTLTLLAQHALATGVIGSPDSREDTSSDDAVPTEATPADDADRKEAINSDVIGRTGPSTEDAERAEDDDGSDGGRRSGECAAPVTAGGIAETDHIGEARPAPHTASTAGGCGLPVMRLGRPGRARPAIQVVVAATTLLGLDDHPGVLTGYGAIDAATARRIALADEPPWQRLLTDPVTGTLLEISPSSYRIPDALARHVRARDRQCAVPGCTTPSDRCDLDHVIPFPLGPTTADNLAPLCRRHHLLKTHGGYALSREPDGAYRWSTPFGNENAAPPERLVPDPAPIDPAFLEDHPLSSSTPPPAPSPEPDSDPGHRDPAPRRSDPDSDSDRLDPAPRPEPEPGPDHDPDRGSDEPPPF